MYRLQIHQWSDSTIRKVTREKWAVRGDYITRVVDMMVTPKVVEEVRKHFNCSILEGAELEDQGGEGTALTHWEKRILEVFEYRKFLLTKWKYGRFIFFFFLSLIILE